MLKLLQWPLPNRRRSKSPPRPSTPPQPKNSPPSFPFRYIFTECSISSSFLKEQSSIFGCVISWWPLPKFSFYFESKTLEGFWWIFLELDGLFVGRRGCRRCCRRETGGRCCRHRRRRPCRRCCRRIQTGGSGGRADRVQRRSSVLYYRNSTSKFEFVY